MNCLWKYHILTHNPRRKKDSKEQLFLQALLGMILISFLWEPIRPTFLSILMSTSHGSVGNVCFAFFIHFLLFWLCYVPFFTIRNPESTIRVGWSLDRDKSIWYGIYSSLKILQRFRIKEVHMCILFTITCFFLYKHSM